jgi:threonine/homoserine/homoserine lactone efflux protein
VHFDFSRLPTFLITTAVVIMTPGLDAFLLLRTSMRSGIRAGLLTLAGIRLATVVQFAVVISGLGVALTRYPVLITALRWAGAAYLLYLAIAIVRKLFARNGSEDAGEMSDRPFRRGFLSAATNPKTLLFSLALLPQFIGSGRPVAQLTMLALVFIGFAAVWELMIVITASRIAPALRRRSVRTAFDAVCATIFVTISVSLVLT